MMTTTTSSISASTCDDGPCVTFVGNSFTAMSHTASLPSVVDLAETVGEASVPCECRHCPPHRPGTGCTCDTAARWMVRIAHNAGSVEGGNVCGQVAPLCDVCLEVAKAWALQSVAETDVCIFCGAPVRVASDLITSVVSLW